VKGIGNEKKKETEGTEENPTVVFFSFFSSPSLSFAFFFLFLFFLLSFFLYPVRQSKE